MLRVFRRLRLLGFSIRARLGLIQILLLLALLTISVVASRAIDEERRSGQELAMLNAVQRLHLDGDMMLDALRADVEQALRLTEDEAQAAGTVLADLHEDTREYEADLEALQKVAMPASLQRGFAAIHLRASHYIALVNRLVTTAVSDHKQALTLEPPFSAAFDDLLKLNDEMTTRLSTQSQAAEGEALQEASTGKVWITVAGLVTALLAWGFVALIAGSVRHSLRQVCDAARALATGNLSVRSEIDSEDEVGELAGSLNKMADDLQNMVDRLLAEADRDAFGAQLTQALEMAESETDVHGIVSRAMGEVADSTPMELLLTDSNRSTLRRVAEHPGSGAPGCTVDSLSGCAAIRRGTPIVFDDSDALNACPKLRQRPGGSLSAACVPVGFMGRSVGVLHTTGAVNTSLPTQKLAQLTALGVQAGARIGALRAFERTRLHAYTDALTGLSNRRALEQVIQDLATGSASYAFALVDVDYFKKLNDAHGHDAGDRALRLFAEVLRKSIRHADQAARWGGEEFAILFPGASAEQALDVIQRIRADLAEMLLSSSGIPFTASFGIADSAMGASFEEVLRIADEALYRSKDEGRDRATVGAGTASASTSAPPAQGQLQNRGVFSPTDSLVIPSAHSHLFKAK